MLVDSWYDPYLGVVILIRVIDGAIRKGQAIKFMAAGTRHLVDRVGCFRPKIEQLDQLAAGEIGFITAQIKEVARPASATPSPTPKRPTAEALPGFKEVQPVVFCGLFPTDAADFDKLRESIYKLRLNDAIVQLRDRDQRRARLRLPLRLPRPAPPRDHPGAADPRI